MPTMPKFIWYTPVFQSPAKSYYIHFIDCQLIICEIILPVRFLIMGPGECLKIYYSDNQYFIARLTLPSWSQYYDSPDLPSMHTAQDRVQSRIFLIPPLAGIVPPIWCGCRAYRGSHNASADQDGTHFFIDMWFYMGKYNIFYIILQPVSLIRHNVSDLERA